MCFVCFYLARGFFRRSCGRRRILARPHSRCWSTWRPCRISSTCPRASGTAFTRRRGSAAPAATTATRPTTCPAHTGTRRYAHTDTHWHTNMSSCGQHQPQQQTFRERWDLCILNLSASRSNNSLLLLLLFIIICLLVNFTGPVFNERKSQPQEEK